MNRFVRKCENGILYSPNGYQCLEKLYDLEDVEQSVGCPLDVVFKLIGSHIILDGEPCYVMGILKDGDNLCIHYSKVYCAYDDIEPLSNYGKTFWIYEEVIKNE